MTPDAQLKKLAGKNPARLEVLAARESRKKSRSRRITCTACGENEYDDRGVEDVCAPCLADMWGAKNVLAGAYKAGKAADMMVIWLPNRAHWIKYPHLNHGDDRPGEDKPFYREGEDSPRTLQHLFMELVDSLAPALPVDPGSQQDRDWRESLLPCDGGFFDDIDKHMVMMPKRTVEVLRHLWEFIQWHSCEAYLHGFNTGKSLLSQMNLGEITHEGFLAEVAEQTASLQEKMRPKKIAKGRRR